MRVHNKHNLHHTHHNNYTHEKKNVKNGVWNNERVQIEQKKRTNQLFRWVQWWKSDRNESTERKIKRQIVGIVDPKRIKTPVQVMEQTRRAQNKLL